MFQILDVFNSIQSLQKSNCSKNIVQLENTVEKSYNGLSFHALNETFLSLQTALKSSLSVYGGNNYSLSCINYSESNASKMFNLIQSYDLPIFSNAYAAVNSSIGYEGCATLSIM